MNMLNVLGTGFTTSIITTWLAFVRSRKNSMIKCRPILNVETLEEKPILKMQDIDGNPRPCHIPYSLKIENLSNFDCYHVVIKVEIETDLGYEDFNKVYPLRFDYSVIKSGEIKSINILSDVAKDIALKEEGLGANKRGRIPVDDYIEKVGSYKIKKMSIDFNSQELERLRYKFKPANDYKVGKLIWKNQDHYKPKTFKDVWYKTTDKANELRIKFLNWLSIFMKN